MKNSTMQIHFYILFLLVNLIASFILGRYFVGFFEADNIFRWVVISFVILNFTYVGAGRLKEIDWGMQKRKALKDVLSYLLLTPVFLTMMYGVTLMNFANVYNLGFGEESQVVLFAQKNHNSRPSKGHPEFTIVFGTSRNLRGEGRKISKEEYDSLPNDFSALKISKSSIFGTTVIQYVYPE